MTEVLERTPEAIRKNNRTFDNYDDNYEQENLTGDEPVTRLEQIFSRAKESAMATVNVAKQNFSPVRVGLEPSHEEIGKEREDFLEKAGKILEENWHSVLGIGRADDNADSENTGYDNPLRELWELLSLHAHGDKALKGLAALDVKGGIMTKLLSGVRGKLRPFLLLSTFAGAGAAASERTQTVNIESQREYISPGEELLEMQSLNEAQKRQPAPEELRDRVEPFCVSWPDQTQEDIANGGRPIGELYFGPLPPGHKYEGAYVLRFTQIESVFLEAWVPLLDKSGQLNQDWLRKGGALILKALRGSDNCDLGYELNLPPPIIAYINDMDSDPAGIEFDPEHDAAILPPESTPTPVPPTQTPQPTPTQTITVTPTPSRTATRIPTARPSETPDQKLERLKVLSAWAKTFVELPPPNPDGKERIPEQSRAPGRNSIKLARPKHVPGVETTENRLPTSPGESPRIVWTVGDGITFEILLYNSETGEVPEPYDAKYELNTIIKYKIPLAEGLGPVAADDWDGDGLLNNWRIAQEIARQIIEMFEKQDRASNAKPIVSQGLYEWAKTVMAITMRSLPDDPDPLGIGVDLPLAQVAAETKDSKILFMVAILSVLLSGAAGIKPTTRKNKEIRNMVALLSAAEDASYQNREEEKNADDIRTRLRDVFVSNHEPQSGAEKRLGKISPQKQKQNGFYKRRRF